MHYNPKEKQSSVTILFFFFVMCFALFYFILFLLFFYFWKQKQLDLEKKNYGINCKMDRTCNAPLKELNKNLLQVGNFFFFFFGVKER